MGQKRSININRNDYLTMRIAAILLFFHLLGSTSSFSSLTKLRHSNQLHDARTNKNSPPLLASAPPRILEETQSSLTDETRSSSLLELDLEQGCIREGRRVLLNGLNPSIWSATRVANDDDSSLFLHTRHAKESAQFEAPLGDLLSCNRLLACARISRYWMGPRVGTSGKDVPFDTQFMLLELDSDDDTSKEQEYALLLPLIDNGFRASLYYGDDKSTIGVVCAAESGDAAVKAKGMRALYVATGTDPFKLIHKGFTDVADRTGTFKTLDQKILPPNVDEFAWCTWDAFYSKVTPDGVLEGVESLRNAGVPPKTLILDDGWQQVSPSPPDWEDLDDEVRSPNEYDFSATLASSASFRDRLMAVGVHAVEKFYGKYVQRAPHGAIGNRIWRFLSHKVIKNQLWNFFDTETDFNRQLSGFLANFKFESKSGDQKQSLKDLVSKLKQDLGVKRVLCWHALHGYWRGMSEDLGKEIGVNVTTIKPTPSPHLLRLEPQLEWDPVSLFGVGVLSTESDLAIFYKHLHAPLIEAGVDGVKVDVQSGVSAVGDGVGGGPHIARLYTEAMENSVSKRFPAENGGTNCINCMCHSTENLYRYKSTSIARAADDFYPERPESQTVHLVNVAYNSLFIGEICLPDWDMFHSLHESAGLHAAARAVGGCPVYVSDKPGEHDVQLLRKLVLPDGSVLRAKLPGRPTRDCLFADVTADNESALKIWNQNANGGVVGAFNVQGVQWNYETHENEVLDEAPLQVSAAVKPYDVETLRDTEAPFVAWRHRSEKLEFLPEGNSEMKSTLNHREWEVFTISPVEINDKLMWAPIGLVNMLNSGGGILSTEPIERDPSAACTRMVCRGPGRFVAFTNVAPSRVILEGDTAIPFTFNESTGELSFFLPSESTEGAAHNVSVLWE